MKINVIHTPCKDCIFAIYNEKTQTECGLNKLSQYKKLGIEILEVYDNDKEFFVINGKKCLGFRDNQWLEKQKIKTIEEAKSIVLNENTIKYIAVLYLEPTNTMQDIENIVASLLNQKIIPKGIMIIKEKTKKYQISMNSLQKLLNSTKIPWRLQNFIDEDMTFDQQIKSIIKSAPMNRFYFLIYPSKFKNHNFAEKIDSYIQSGGSFGCINIDDNLFFSYLTLMYAKNLKDLNILESKDHQTLYETIG